VIEGDANISPIVGTLSIWFRAYRTSFFLRIFTATVAAALRSSP
jgi:hypothetical protein